MLRQVESNGLQIILGGNGALVASQSQAGIWYSVRNGQCDCKGCQAHGHCKHLDAVKALTAKKEEATTHNRDTAILAGPQIDPPLFTPKTTWTRPASKSFEELFPGYVA